MVSADGLRGRYIHGLIVLAAIDEMVRTAGAALDTQGCGKKRKEAVEFLIERCRTLTISVRALRGLAKSIKVVPRKRD